MSGKRSEWLGVADLMEERLEGRRVQLGRQVSAWFDSDPTRLLDRLSHYKFAAKLIGSGKRVLDIGCGEGLGTWVLAVECGFACGIDTDEQAIAVARSNWEADERIEFAGGDLPAGRFDAVTSFGVADPGALLARVRGSLAQDGIAVIGTPCPEGGEHAGERLEAALYEHFVHVFVFGVSDEIVHTGSPAIANYLLAVGCKPRSSSTETAS